MLAPVSHTIYTRSMKFIIILSVAAVAVLSFLYIDRLF